MSEEEKKKTLVFGKVGNIYYIGESDEEFPDNRTEQEKEKDAITDEVDEAWDKLLKDINEKYKGRYRVSACSCCCGGESIDIRVNKLKEKDTNED